MRNPKTLGEVASALSEALKRRHIADVSFRHCDPWVEQERPWPSQRWPLQEYGFATVLVSRRDDEGFRRGLKYIKLRVGPKRPVLWAEFEGDSKLGAKAAQVCIELLHAWFPAEKKQDLWLDNDSAI